MEIRLDKNRKVKVANPEDIFPIMKEILLRENRICRAQEHFWMVGLNQASKILYIELVSLGSSNMTAIQPREALFITIQLAAKQSKAERKKQVQISPEMKKMSRWPDLPQRLTLPLVDPKIDTKRNLRPWFLGNTSLLKKDFPKLPAGSSKLATPLQAGITYFGDFH